jgi:PAS domain S-box-containing protein
LPDTPAVPTLAFISDPRERREAEQVLRDSEAALRAILDASTESIWLFSADGVVLAGNKTALARWGRPPDQVFGRRIQDLAQGDPDLMELLRSRAERIGAAVRSGRPTEFEDVRAGLRFLHTCYPVTGLGGQADRVAVFSRDITERRRAEEAIRESAAVLSRYELLAGHSRDIFLFIRRDDGRILEANAAAVQAYGYSRDEILARTINDLRAPEEQERAARQLASADGRGVLFESVHRRRDGRTFPVEVSSRGATIDGTRMLISVVRDITERKKVEQALRESEQRFRTLADHARDSIVRLDRDGRFVYVNPFYERLVGRPSEEILGRSPEELGRTQNDAEILARIRQVLDTGQPKRFDIQSVEGRWWDVQYIPEFHSGEPTLLSISRDVTDRRRGEQELREANERTTRILEGMAESFYSLDSQWRFVQVNPAAERAPFGRPERELLGKVIWDVFPALVGTRIQQHYFDALEKQQQESYEARSPLNGRWYEVFMFPRADGLDVYLRDIEDRKHTEEALREALSRLEEADRRKNDFLAVLSHELRNPLMPIGTGLHLLELAPPGSEAAARARDVIRRQTVQLVRLVDDLLDITRITHNKIRLQRRRLDLNAVVQRTVDDHRSFLEEKGIRVWPVYAPQTLPIDGDGARVSQIVGNLLQNASKFTLAGGTVSVRTRADGDQATIEVSDTGVGIDAAVLRDLFQPFMQAERTLDRTRGGLGLGLALVKSLTEMHGGRVRAESGGPGQGARFTVELPLSPEASAGGPVEDGARVARSRRVLVIEDNVDAAEMLRTVLELGGHLVRVANDGASGLAEARAFGPEVVLCDIGLPGLDGFGVARAMRADEALQDVVLVALSGYVFEEDRHRAMAAGFDRHIAKPASPETLARLLEDLGPSTQPAAPGRGDRGLD